MSSLLIVNPPSGAARRLERACGPVSLRPGDGPSPPGRALLLLPPFVLRVNAMGRWLTRRVCPSAASLLVYLFGMLFTENLVMIFIITILLLAADFYYLKNIAGRRLVGLRWWNEVDPASGDSHWVFESSEPGTKTINPTDSRFFWLAMYAQPVLWIALAVLALVRLKFIWLPLVGKSFSVYPGAAVSVPVPMPASMRGGGGRTVSAGAVGWMLTSHGAQSLP